MLRHRKLRTLTRQGTNLTLAELLHSLNPVLRGWTNYFRAGSPAAPAAPLRCGERGRQRAHPNGSFASGRLARVRDRVETKRRCAQFIRIAGALQASSRVAKGL
ncbi:MAG: group II intron maturase-specific domain-containing protein, partial [Solirubrobacteraceae bacterium]